MVELFSQQEAFEMMESAKLSEGLARGRREGIAEGKREGIAEGKIKNLMELTADGLISPQIGAQRAGISESEFLAQIKSAYPYYQLPQRVFVKPLKSREAEGPCETLLMRREIAWTL